MKVEFAERNIDIDCFRKTLKKPSRINRFILKQLQIITEAEYRNDELLLAKEQKEEIGKLTERDIACVLNGLLSFAWLENHIDLRGYILDDELKSLMKKMHTDYKETQRLNYLLLKMIYAEETGRSDLRFIYYRLKNYLMGKKVYIVCGAIISIAIVCLQGNGRIWLICLSMLAAVMQYEINENTDKYL